MAVLDVGLNRMRDLLAADIDEGVAGTSADAIDVTDTDLIAPVAATESTPTVTKSDKTITVSYTMDSLTGNGNTFYEWGTRMNSGAITFNRALTAGLAKTSAVEVNTVTLIYLDR